MFAVRVPPHRRRAQMPSRSPPLSARARRSRFRGALSVDRLFAGGERLSKPFVLSVVERRHEIMFLSDSHRLQGSPEEPRRGSAGCAWRHQWCILRRADGATNKTMSMTYIPKSRADQYE